MALLTAAALVAALLALPLVFLLIEAAGADWGQLSQLIFRPLTWSLLWNTVRLSAVVTVALLAVRHAGRVRHLLERSTYLVLGMPCVEVAFALSYFTERYLAGFGYGTAALLVACYAIMFFPLALVGVKASLARAPASLDEVARSLGQRRLAVLCRVTARLAGPGLVAAFCLVFLSW